MNIEGCLTLLLYAAVALAIAALVYALSAYAWGETAGIICAGIAAFMTVLMLCSVYTGSDNY